MFSSIKRRATCSVLSATLLMLAGCAQRPAVNQNNFYNVDSLISSQVRSLKARELDKTVTFGEKKEQAKLIPDTIQWENELEMFRLIAQINKPSFRDAYEVNEIRDTNSNLMVREIKAKREVPVPSMRLFYLRTQSDLRRIEATLNDENSVYSNKRRMVLQLDRDHQLSRYRVDGFQKMIMGDSVHFIIEGMIE